MARGILRVLDSLISLCLVVVLLAFGAYSVYALWDNNQVYTAADIAKEDMIKLKPSYTINADGSISSDDASFEELLAVNSDVVGWITLDGTEVDYPVLQGDTVLDYINRDVYGNFALAGSIFLDPTCAGDFTDAYSLIYGHHMEGSRMFGDLDLYEDAEFFSENNTGVIITPTTVYKLEIFACLLIGSSEDMIFEPSYWTAENIDELLIFAEENALHINADVISAIRGDENPQIVALSTCSSEFTDARTVILARMVSYSS